MGTFLALSGVIGKTQEEVSASLKSYASKHGGGFEQKDDLNSNGRNCCIIGEANNNTTVLYPQGYLEWDESSKFLSVNLKATVFSFHIHDGDLWMYILYSNGNVVDQFNPIPDYWDENISIAEMKSWDGNSSIITKYIPYVSAKEIEKYLVRWNLEDENPPKAYVTDEHTQGDWQLIDFIKKIKLTYPVDGNGNPNGMTYKFWTDQMKLESDPKSTIIKKPWWKFW